MNIVLKDVDTQDELLSYHSDIIPRTGESLFMGKPNTPSMDGVFTVIDVWHTLEKSRCIRQVAVICFIRKRP